MKGKSKKQPNRKGEPKLGKETYLHTLGNSYCPNSYSIGFDHNLFEVLSIDT